MPSSVSREREREGETVRRRSIVKLSRLERNLDHLVKRQSVRSLARPTTDDCRRVHARLSGTHASRRERESRESSRHPGGRTPAHTPRHVVNHASPTTCHSRGETAVVARPPLADSRTPRSRFRDCLTRCSKQSINKNRSALVHKFSRG